MATDAAPNVENPKVHTDLNSTPPDAESDSLTTPLPPSAGGGADSKGKPAVATVSNHDVDGGGAVTDVQKKMKRAERFGVPVQLSEKEKRNSRAERFGTNSATEGLESSKTSEELKRKARAERFGIVQSAPSDDDAKKKARLSRFGSSVINSMEEDKKKARALRFSQLNSDSKANGKGNIEVVRDFFFHLYPPHGFHERNIDEATAKAMNLEMESNLKK